MAVAAVHELICGRTSGDKSWEVWAVGGPIALMPPASAHTKRANAPSGQRRPSMPATHARASVSHCECRRHWQVAAVAAGASSWESVWSMRPKPAAGSCMPDSLEVVSSCPCPSTLGRARPSGWLTQSKSL